MIRRTARSPGTRQGSVRLRARARSDTGCGRLGRRALWERVQAGSIPVAPTISGCSSGAERARDKPVVAGATPAFRTEMPPFYGRDTTERRLLEKVRLLPVVPPFTLPSGRGLDSKSELAAFDSLAACDPCGVTAARSIRAMRHGFPPVARGSCRCPISDRRVFDSLQADCGRCRSSRGSRP